MRPYPAMYKYSKTEFPSKQLLEEKIFIKNHPSVHTAMKYIKHSSLSIMNTANHACLAQLVERKTFNLVVMGSSPMVGKFWRKPIKKIPHSALV